LFIKQSLINPKGKQILNHVQVFNLKKVEQNLKRSYNRIMKMENMTKQQLIDSINKAEKLINNKKWIKSQSKFWVGVYVVHLAKLRQELKGRK